MSVKDRGFLPPDLFGKDVRTLSGRILMMGVFMLSPPFFPLIITKFIKIIHRRAGGMDGPTG